ncbi:hypothetical protein EDB89DRAFT_1915966 [Lactarius sanguifluus]|nr:hypothetical protein EDB89DRAFT_1915966 [Lactarius sanguifluus]
MATQVPQVRPLGHPCKKSPLEIPAAKKWLNILNQTRSQAITTPKTWHTHLVFHKNPDPPYHMNDIHEPNFTQPPPEIIQKGANKHYKVEAVLKSKVPPNKKGVPNLIKWKGYPGSNEFLAPITYS